MSYRQQGFSANVQIFADLCCQDADYHYTTERVCQTESGLNCLYEDEHSLLEHATSIRKVQSVTSESAEHKEQTDK
jgi:hypothetical protein